MTPTALDIAHRLVAAPWWEWRPAMLSLQGLNEEGEDWWPGGWRVARDSRGWVKVGPLCRGEAADNPRVAPDLTDPATAGVLLAMLAAATPKRLEVAYEADGWWVDGPCLAGPCDTLGEAVALALLEVRS